jgi:protoporphyrinogen oxidase
LALRIVPKDFDRQNFSQHMSFTRRDILQSFLGIPIALAACSSPSVPVRYDGEIVGASDSVGHKIRDGLKIDPPAERWEDRSVVIVGGGVAGLTAAWRLLQAGFEDFVLVELEKSPGGTSVSGTSSLVSYPWGAHYLPVPMSKNRALVSLLEEMGIVEGHTNEGEPIVGEQFLCRDPEERVFYKGTWYSGLYLHAGETTEDRLQLEAFNREINRWVSWRDSKGRRAFDIPLALSSNAEEVTSLDKISMSEWMDKHQFTSSRLRWFVDYGCRDDYGLKMEQTSAWAGIFYFASRIINPNDESQPLITFPEGNGRLVSYLYEKVKAKVRLGVAAVEIVPTNPRGVDLFAIDHTQNSSIGIHTDNLIFAAPHFLARYLIRPYRDNPPSYISEFQYGSWMVANLFLKDRPKWRGYPLAWDNVLYESPSLGYVVATHQRGLDRGPTVFTYYYPLCEDDPKIARAKLLSLDWKQSADIILTDLSRAHKDITSLVERVDVMRWGHAMIRPRPDFIWGDARSIAIKPYRSIHFAHSDLSGVALFEEAFYQGIKAAEEVLKAKSIKFSSSYL